MINTKYETSKHTQAETKDFNISKILIKIFRRALRVSRKSEEFQEELLQDSTEPEVYKPGC